MTRVRWSGRRLLTRAERPPRWPDTLAGALPNVSFSLVSHHSAARTVTITIYARVLSVTDGAHARIRPQARMTAMRTAGPRLRRIFDSSRAPASDVADRLPRIFEDHNLVGPEDAGFREMAPRSRQTGRP